MVLRKIIEINEEKCNGCGLCVPACHEGALQIVDGKAKLVSDIYCDGLGDCLGECPQDAIQIIEREAAEYDDDAVQERLAKMSHGDGSADSFTKVSKEGSAKAAQTTHGAHGAHPQTGDSCHTGGCPGSRMMTFSEGGCQGAGPVNAAQENATNDSSDAVQLKSELKQWPVQITLVPPNAPYFEDASLLVCADCVPFAYPNLHNHFMKDKVVLVGCPKLDDAQSYIEKFAAIFKANNIKDITLTRMEVPCCGGMKMILERSLQMAGKDIPVEDVIIGVQGEVKK